MNTLTLNFHIQELKWRIFYTLLSTLACTLVAYEFRIEILYLASQPLINQGITQFVYTNLSEAFITYLKLSILVGLYITLPLWILQIYRFLKPGLYLKEVNILFKSICLGFLFILIGLITLWVIISPTLYKFFVGFTTEGNIYDLKLMIKIKDLVAFITNTILATTWLFGLPGALALMPKYKQMLNYIMKYRSIVWFLILTFSAIVTPPDVISQILFGVPLILAIEISCLVANIGYQYTHITLQKG